jgi:small subunit ribosomal protein S6
MERFFRIDDKVMKFMTILLDGNADLDVIKADLAEKAAAAEQAAWAAQTAAEQADEAVETEAPTENNEPIAAKKEE